MAVKKRIIASHGHADRIQFRPSSFILCFCHQYLLQRDEDPTRRMPMNPASVQRNTERRFGMCGRFARIVSKKKLREKQGELILAYPK
jgi:hypothetical protein